MDTDDLIQHACATGWRTHKDVTKTAGRAKAMLVLMGGLDVEWPTVKLAEAAQMLEEGGASGATVNRYAASLLSAWKIGYKSGLVAQHPPDFAWRPESPGRDRTPTRGEVAAMLRGLRKSGRHTVDARLARFLYRTGARLGEALAARAIDVTVYPGGATAVCLEDSKSGHPRKILIPACYGWIGRHVWDHQSREHLFPSAPSSFSHHWRRCRKAAGIGDWFVPHSLRHACATEMARAGVALSTIARTLGHQSIKTTYRYTHADDEDILGALDAR